jgi:hypothetical protein
MLRRVVGTHLPPTLRLISRCSLSICGI